jgi:hypothetical protein
MQLTFDYTLSHDVIGAILELLCGIIRSVIPSICFHRVNIPLGGQMPNIKHFYFLYKFYTPCVIFLKHASTRQCAKPISVLGLLKVKVIFGGQSQI